MSESVLPLLIGAKSVAVLLSISRSTLYEWCAAGRVPAPVKIGGRTLWRRVEIEAWVEAGCPGRARWGAMYRADR